MELAILQHGRIPDHLTSELPSALRIGTASDGSPARNPRPIMVSRAGWIAPRPFADLVETLEPGLRKAWPLRVESAIGVVGVEQFFLIEPGPRIDAIIPNKSNVTLRPAQKIDDGKGAGEHSRALRN